MGLYGTQVVPRVTDRVMDDPHLHEVRARVCAGLSGSVIELGFGSGLNVRHYPVTVERVAAVEPSDVGWRLAGPRVASSPVPVQRLGRDGQAMPFPDDAFDSALSTWTLCSVPDPTRALAEVRRVLRPGGVLHLVEHGRAPDPSVRRWQHRLDPLSVRLQGGCHLDRPVQDLLEAAGLEVLDLRRYYQPGSPRPFAAFSEGAARA